VYDGETHSVVRRQFVIIVGLTLETEELNPGPEFVVKVFNVSLNMTNQCA
jgi:hypothetical protein